MVDNGKEDPRRNLLKRIPRVGQIFDLHHSLGKGTFSTVLLATLKKERGQSNRQKFAIKHHNPTSHPDRILKELQCIMKIGGSNNVIGVIFCLRHEDSVAFVMPYMIYDRFVDFYKKMEPEEIRLYIKNLLIALRHVHSFNVIHRDVKPSNFLYNRSEKKYLLIDFGLSHHMNTSENKNNSLDHTPATKNTASIETEMFESKDCHVSSVESKLIIQEESVAGSKKSNCKLQKESVIATPTTLKNNESVKEMRKHKKCNCHVLPKVCSICLVKPEMIAARAGTPGYRPPEVLLKSENQSTAVDIWAVGVILLSILSTVYPFFNAPNDYIALCEIISIFGDEEVQKTAATHGRVVTMSCTSQPKDLRKLCLNYRNRKRENSNGERCQFCNFCRCICKRDAPDYNLDTPQNADNFPKCLYEVLYEILKVNPEERITAAELLRHPFFADCDSTS